MTHFIKTFSTFLNESEEYDKWSSAEIVLDPKEQKSLVEFLTSKGPREGVFRMRKLQQKFPELVRSAYWQNDVKDMFFDSFPELTSNTPTAEKLAQEIKDMIDYEDPNTLKEVEEQVEKYKREIEAYKKESENWMKRLQNSLKAAEERLKDIQANKKY